MTARIGYWVANWNLSRAQAVVLLGRDAAEMLDCIAGDLAAVLAARPAVDRFAGYITGTEDIRWTTEQIKQIRDSDRALLLIDQSNSDQPLRADVKLAKDVESGASLIDTAVKTTHARYHDNLDSLIYIEQSELSELEDALAAAGLPRGEVAAYQYASPTSKPTTVVPGTRGKTIQELNCDLSVIRPDWLPLPGGADAHSGPVVAVPTRERTWVDAFDLHVELELNTGTGIPHVSGWTRAPTPKGGAS